MLRNVLRIVQAEVKVLCSDRTNSVLLSKSKEDLCSFSHEKVYNELVPCAPTLLEILKACTGHCKASEPNCKQVICLCAVILAKQRRPSMSLMHRIISVILYAGHCSKQVSFHVGVNYVIGSILCLLLIFRYLSGSRKLE